MFCQFVLPFPLAILVCISAKTLPPATTCSSYCSFFIRCDKPELTCWCLCSLHLSRHSSGEGYFRSEGRQKVVPTDESSSLHVEKPCREAGKVSCQDRHSTFNNSVRDAIRRGAADNAVQKHKERLTGAWRQMSTLRRRYQNWCKGGDIKDCTHTQ